MNYSYFSRELTDQAIIFEGIMMLIGVGVFSYGIYHYRFFVWRFFILALGVFFFEGLTGALRDISHLGRYAYIHNDLSWVMTLTWTCIICIVRFFYDALMQKKTLIKEFLIVIFGATFLSGIVLIVLKEIGIFGYSLTMRETLSGATMILGRPLEASIYIPVFIFTVYTFYKYWELAMYDKKLYMNFKISPQKDIFIAIIVIGLIGYLMYPLLSMNLLGASMLIISLIIGLILTSMTINIIKDIPLFQRYVSAVVLYSIFGVAIMTILMDYGFIILAESVKNTHTMNTIFLPGTSLSDVEYIGIIFFSCLMIALMKYFKVVTDTAYLPLEEKKMTFQGWKSLINNIK